MIPELRLSKTYDSIRKTVHLLLAFVLTMPLLFQGGSMASASVGGFTFVDGGGANGVNVIPTRAANDPSIVAFNNEIYAAWQETNNVDGRNVNQIHVRKYKDATWTTISGPNGININASKMAGNPTLAVFNGAVYAAWKELGTYNGNDADKIRISRYTNAGSAWENVTGNVDGLNVDPAKAAFAPSLAVLGNALYASWSENGQIRVKKFDGTNWTSAEEEGSTGLNSKGATSPSMIASNNALYVMWSELDSDAYHLRGKKYDGVSWTSLDNGVPGGLNIKPSSIAVEPSLAIYNDKLYVAWEENNVDRLDYQIRVKRYDEPGWTSVDGGDQYGLNINSGFRAANVELAEFNNHLYAIWQEVKALTIIQHIRVKKYDGTKWTSADGGGPNGLNKNAEVAALNPDAAVMNNQLFVAWQEKSGNANQIRVAKQLPPAVISVTFNISNIGIFQGKSDQLIATVNTVGDAANTVMWTSNDANNKVTVDQTGTIKIAADATPGEYEIRATSTVDSSKFAIATIRVVAVSITRVTVSPSAANLVQGEERQLTANVSENGGATKTVTWKSNDVNNKVTVSSAGKVLVDGDAAPGPYTITATSTFDNSKFGTSIITVTAAPPAINSVTVNPPTASVEQGGSEQFTATVAAVGGAAKTVEWTSNDGKVTVSETGKVTVAEDTAPGQYTITATSTVNGSKYGTATITVTAVPPGVNSVTVTPGSVSMVRGGEKQLEVKVNAVGGADKTVTWSTSDGDVAVDNTGKVTVAPGADLGNYTIKATSVFDSNKVGIATITVVETPAINSVTVNPSAENVAQGNSLQLEATVDAVGDADETVKWTSSDPDQVAVDSTGNVTVEAEATLKEYTITATSNFDSSKTGEAVITVTQAPEIRSVTVTPSTENVMQGTSKQLDVAVDAVGDADETVTWTSSDPEQVAVDNTGNITVAADATPKNYTITATSNFDNSKTGEAVITVTEAPAIRSVIVSPSSKNVARGGETQLTAQVDAAGGADETVTWSPSDGDVAVDNYGKVTVAAGADLGNYMIKATSVFDSSKVGIATITVVETPVINSVIVTPSTENVMQGTSKQLDVAVDAVGDADETVTWTSSDPEQVAVDNTGNVTVAADAMPKNYTITATSNFDSSKTGTAVIMVTEAPIYSIAAIGNQTLTALTQGYISGAQENKSITILNSGTVSLNNLSVNLSGMNANDFVMTQLDSTSLTRGGSTSFDIHAKDGLPAGTYTTTVNVSADQLMPVKFTVTQAVNLPNAPANPQNLVAAGGDRQVSLSWNTVSDATNYRIYMATDASQASMVEVATVTSATYSVPNLVNGITYYFIVKAENPGGLSAASNQIGATPSTLPGTPTNVTAEAGNGQAVITFTPPIDNGGSPITGYEVTASPGNAVVIGGASPITLTGLTNGTSYTFTVKAINSAGKSTASAQSNAIVPKAPPSGDNGNSTPSQPSTPTAPSATNEGVDILVNGKVENAGIATISKRDNHTVMTVAVDQKKLDERLAAEGQHAIVTIPINQRFDITVGELNGQMVKNMEDKQAVLEFKTDHATYTLPAQQINIRAISEQVGELIHLQDIKVRIEIAIPTADTLKVVENAAVKDRLTLVAQPLSFTVRAIYGDKIVDVTNFASYVERTITIPDEADSSKITTGVVVEQDGSVRHVPTKVRNINGKYEAQINSLTNSAYAVVWHPIEFSDAEKHWAKNAVNDMGSRMVVYGTGNRIFSPNLEITRAEFAAILVRGLGLKLESGVTPYSDVKSEIWYSSAISTAYSHRLISGLEDGTFRPNDKITREQAMVILSKAMAITDLKDKLIEQSADATLHPFEDASGVSSWARSSVADIVQAGIVIGREGDLLVPKGYMTRAEVATMVQRLLQKSNLI
ncbi:Ig-like domain-containing protein [Cohnella herbarum]|uniref:Uncharacterized protein n=1 Tax=Cohnella herbarum TaxID=2728023 RepID=A0A7Z2VKJ8_9BACL|nr:Ig-like domain-containing protein [Cohnella herbarum]QJD84670.1 hypothetical protein HH215_16760 [Cohnella herbarum]